ncbi:MAG TPA: MFS transporter [Candidatus Limnocylindrales bacterium]|nr:MFS transporter [Candidatus Limnocylindrales bacterium]
MAGVQHGRARTADGGPLRVLRALTPTGRARVPLAWSLYDFANTIFSYAVVSTAIGLWLTDPLRLGAGPGQLVQGVAVAVSVGLNALVSPVLGALSDRGGRRLPYLLVFTVLCIVPTALIGPSPALIGAALFTLANFAYQAALIYYDATLPLVARVEARGRLSGIGVAIGYLGTIFVGLLLFLADVPVEGIFVITAVLFALFAAPIFLVLREPDRGAERLRPADVASRLRQLPLTISHARAVPGLLRFLVGRFFYSDAVNTIIVVMSVISVRAMGMTTQQFLLFSVGLTVVAVAASVVWGRLVDRLGPKRTLLRVLASWAVGLVLGALALSFSGTLAGSALFIVAGGIVASGLGGVQVADRVLMVRLSPPPLLGEFFGLYGLVGKGSQVIGQLVYGVTVFLFLDALGNGAYQLAVLTLLVTMAIGYRLVSRVEDGWPGEAPGEQVAAVAPPERLAPSTAPLEPRA